MDAQTVRITSRSTIPCPGCGLTLDSITTVGAGRGEGEYCARAALSPVVVNERLLVTSTVPIQMFDLGGKFIGTLGRQGQGPGEFPTWIAGGLATGAAGTLHAFLPQQAIVFDSALRFVRAVGFASGLRRPTVLDDGNYVGLGRMPSAQGPPTASDYAASFEEPLFHVFDSNGVHIRSVGSTLSLADDIVAPGIGGTIWTGKRSPYEVSQWSQDGTLLRLIARETPRFARQPYIGPWPYVRGDGPRPHLLTVHQDSEGFLWTAARVVKPDWRSAIRDGDDLCCESLIEVLDPTTGVLVGAVTLPMHVQRILDHGYIAALGEGTNGEPLLVLYRARVTRSIRP
jgi:hypothetical protein